MNSNDALALVRENMNRIAELGEWPEGTNIERSLPGRIPSEDGSKAPGFDAGIACALDLIPRDKQRLSAILHQAYTPEAIEQIQRETKNLDEDSETCWWLAASSISKTFKEQRETKHLDADPPTCWWLPASSICVEVGVDSKTFEEQLDEFSYLLPAESRISAAQSLWAQMINSFDTSMGFPFGLTDGCIQGAYVAGHPFGVHYASNYSLHFIGTFHPSLGLEDFDWSDEVDDQNRKKSGLISPQFVKCANKNELFRAVDKVKLHFGL